MCPANARKSFRLSPKKGSPTAAFFKPKHVRAYHTRYRNGELVWAKQPGVPYWPARVCTHPEDVIDEADRPLVRQHPAPQFVFVEFCHHPTYAWIPTQAVRPWDCAEFTAFTLASNKPVFLGALREAAEEARKDPTQYDPINAATIDF